MWNPQIPEGEVENVLDVYWQMLRELEAHRSGDPTTRHLIEAGYEVLNRCGVTNTTPEHCQKEESEV